MLVFMKCLEQKNLTLERVSVVVVNVLHDRNLYITLKTAPSRIILKNMDRLTFYLEFSRELSVLGALRFSGSPLTSN